MSVLVVSRVGGEECSRRWQSVTVVVAACSFVLELVEEL